MKKILAVILGILVISSMLLLAGCDEKKTEDLLEKAWGYNSDADINSVWLYVSYLRKRLAGINSKVEIVTRRNFGYKLEITA